MLVEHIGYVAGAMGAIGATCPNIKQTIKCVNYYNGLSALIYQVACTNIFM